MEMQPVAVWEGGGVRRTLNDVADAAEFLENKWPKASKGTYFYDLALELAQDALQGTRDVGLFRRVFVTAAKEARIYAPPEEHSSVALPAHIARPYGLRKGNKRRSK
jgi:hypothetical protein